MDSFPRRQKIRIWHSMCQDTKTGASAASSTKAGLRTLAWASPVCFPPARAQVTTKIQQSAKAAGVGRAGRSYLSLVASGEASPKPAGPAPASLQELARCSQEASGSHLQPTLLFFALKSETRLGSGGSSPATWRLSASRALTG